MNGFCHSDSSIRPAPHLASGSVSVRSATVAAPPGNLSGLRPRLRVWRLYWVDGAWVQADLHAKLLQAWQALRGHGDAGAVLVLYTPEESTAVADARLAAFLVANATRLDQLLRALRTP
jgi:EpsI family protein